MVDPDGKLESIIAFCAILMSRLDLWRRHSAETNNKPKEARDVTEPRGEMQLQSGFELMQYNASFHYVKEALFYGSKKSDFLR